MNYSNKELIKFWIEKSHKALEVAELEMEKGFYEFSVSHLYYSAFYILSAYLQIEGISFKKHSAVRSFFHKMIVKNNLIDKKFSKIYDELYFSREEADYLPFTEFSYEEVSELLKETKVLVREIEKIINSKLQKEADDNT